MLSVGCQSLLQGLHIQVLNTRFLLDRECGGRARGLTEHHENRFHPNRPKGNMRTRHTHRHQQIADLVIPGNETVVTNRIGSMRMNADISFILHEALVRDMPPGMV